MRAAGRCKGMNQKHATSAQVRRQADRHEILEDAVGRERRRNDAAFGRTVFEVEAQLTEAREVGNGRAALEIIAQEIVLLKVRRTGRRRRHVRHEAQFEPHIWPADMRAAWRGSKASLPVRLQCGIVRLACDRQAM